MHACWACSGGHVIEYRAGSASVNFLLMITSTRPSVRIAALDFFCRTADSVRRSFSQLTLHAASSAAEPEPRRNGPDQTKASDMPHYQPGAVLRAGTTSSAVLLPRLIRLPTASTSLNECKRVRLQVSLSIDTGACRQILLGRQLEVEAGCTETDAGFFS